MNVLEEKLKEFESKGYLDQKDLQKFHNVSHVTAGKIMNDPSFPSYLVGNRRRVTVTAFRRYLKMDVQEVGS